MLLQRITKYRKEFALLLMSVMLTEHYAVAKNMAVNTGRYDLRINASSTPIIYPNKFEGLSVPVEKTTVKYQTNAAPVSKKNTDKLNVKQSPLIGGPGQPEMQSFQATGVSNMVNLFTGDFSYNIPLMDVGGYPVNIHYNSGISMDQDASWVGLGWNINPGTISRNMRGLPDDFNGRDSIKKTYNIKPNITGGVTFDFNPEMTGKEIKIKNFNTSIEYNNYTGLGLTVGISPTINSGRASLGKMTAGLDKIDLSLSSKNGIDVHPNLSAQMEFREGNDIHYVGNSSVNLGFNSRRGLTDLSINGSGTNMKKAQAKTQTSNRSETSSPNQPNQSFGLGGGVSMSFGTLSYTPTIQMPFTSFQFSFRAKLGGEIFGFHPSANIGGYYSQQHIASGDRERKLPAYGFLYYQQANDKEEVLLDYNRESDNTYSKHIPHISMPVYTHDLYSVSGEGIGGMFRPYRGDIGYIRDTKIKSKSNTGSLALDFGAGNAVHIGVDITYNHSYTETREWVKHNSLRGTLRFRNADTTFEPVYFRNPAERTINAGAYYNAVGGDDLVRINLGNGTINPQVTNNFTRFTDQKKPYATSTINSSTVKTQRDKRTQVFSYLTAEEAGNVGLDSFIAVYPVNKFFAGKCDRVRCNGSSCDTVKREPRINEFRKAHHISEVTILNPDGKRYVYGIPAYNVKQTDVTFAVDKSRGNLTTGLVGYTPGMDNTTNNKNGKDRFFSKEEMPAYAHSYLLSGILSADYVDVKGDGISDDDIGDAVKFNYSKVYDKTNPYKWRVPFQKDSASYSESMRTDKSDDKGHYIYGEKEIWYLNSIESKTMLATFTLNDPIVSARKDAYGVSDENGDQFRAKSLRYLKKIDLYVKADFIKNGTNAKPVKTVNFEYNYELVPNTISNSGAPEIVNGVNINQAKGKLTLKKIWFTYNGNNKGVKNPYVFTYHTNNPAYNSRSNDRWGNYKDASANPGNMLNSEYPYVIQDSTISATNAAAWTLQTIKLPSGGVIKVDYESDDYAYVQNKRAAQMFQVKGFTSSSSTPWASKTNQLYANNLLTDHLFMYVELSHAVSSKQELFNQYLAGLPNNKLFFRCYVQMPSDSYGSGTEFVSAYADWDDYGLVEAGPTKRAWIKLRKVKGMNPVLKTALQFMRLNLPSKAYPGSDVKEDLAPSAVIKVLGSFFSNANQLLLGFDNYAKLSGWCKTFDTSRSIVRLNNPVYKKYGGGIRVKRVLIYDNWNAMSGQKESSYGQEYNYTTTEEINGKKTVISSGVAIYEPTIGNEENPFHVAMEYTEQSSILAPTFGKYIDNPVGESFFPAPSVGYSKVRVSSVKRKNIKSATGFEETEFFTAKDFPTYSDFTPFDRNSKRQFRSPLRFILKIDLRQYLTLSQGFRVELNDMHGRVKSQATYAENDTLNPLSSTKNYYLADKTNSSKPRLSNNVPVLQTADGTINTKAEIGKDVEVMVDMREQKSETYGLNVEINNDFFVIPTPIPIPISVPSWIPVPNHDVKRFRSVTVMKIVSRYGIIDSVVHIDKGSRVSVKNILYDAETGDVVLSRTQNEFDDPVYNYSYSAHQAYDALGLAYKNINALVHNVTITNGRLNNTYYEKFFTGGDEVMMITREITRKCDNSGSDVSMRRIFKLWAIEGSKIGKPNGIYFIDRNGKLFSSQQGNIKIIRSGRRNLLGDAGSVVSLANPIVPFGQGFKLQFDNATNVINASALEYKENWKVEDKFYTKDTSYVEILTGTSILSPTHIVTKRKEIYGETGQSTPLSDITNKYVVAAMDYVRQRLCHRSYVSFAKTAIQFDFSQLPINLTLDSAKISFAPKDFNLPFPDNPILFNQVCRGDGNTCTRDCSFNFAVPAPYYSKDHASNLKRIKSAWNPSLAYDDNSQITTSNQVVVNNSIYRDVNCTQLIADCIANPSYGLMMELIDQHIANQNASETNYLNFCCPTVPPPPSSPLDYSKTDLGEADSKNITKPIYCGLFLNLWYKYSITTTETLCKSLLTQASSNPYIMGYLGNWRPYRSYVYYDDRKETDLNATNIRTEGTFKTFSSFWKFGANGLTANYDSTKWVWNSEITKFNRKGMELENKDPLGRYNAGLYGYNMTLPVAVAQNSRYQEIAYDGFEDYDFQNDLCAKPCSTSNHLNFSISPAANLSTVEKHSGKYSLKLDQGSSFSTTPATINFIRQNLDALPVGITHTTDTNTIFINANLVHKYCYDAVHTDSSAILPRFSPIPGSKIVVGAWVKEAKGCNCESYTENSISIEFRQAGGAIISTLQLKPSGSMIEGWQRIDSVITVPANAVTYSIRFNASANSITYFDDFRINPFNSNMKTFVYNPVNLRLMAELDENNYATFYEYDDEGTLVRVKKETQRGIKTIKETRSALIKQ